MKHVFLSSLLLLCAVLLAAAPASAKHPTMTVESLEQEGHMPLSTGELEKLIAGRTLNVMSVVEDTVYEMVFFGDGYRLLHNPKKQPGETPGAEGIAVWEISLGRLVTRLDGTPFDVKVYKVGEQYFAARAGEAAVSWEVFPRQGEPPQPFITTNALMQAGIRPLDDEALRSFLVDRTVLARNAETGVRYRLRFRSDGMREVESAKTGTAEDPREYEITNGWIGTTVDGRDFRIRVFKVGDGYLANHSADGSAVKWRISP